MTINALFSVVKFLKYVVTEVVLFSIVDSDSEISMKIGQYLMEVKAYEVKAYKKVCQFFGSPCKLIEIATLMRWKMLDFGRCVKNPFVRVTTAILLPGCSLQQTVTFRTTVVKF